jgi:hypothetical protein
MLERIRRAQMKAGNGVLAKERPERRKVKIQYKEAQGGVYINSSLSLFSWSRF